MNHKNFRNSLTLVLIYSLPWNCSPQHHDRLSIIYSLQTNLISSSNFTSLSFLKLVNELPFFLKRVAKVRLFSLPANFSILFFEFSHIFSLNKYQLIDFQSLTKYRKHIYLPISMLYDSPCGSELQDWPNTNLSVNELQVTTPFCAVFTDIFIIFVFCCAGH